MTYVPMTQADYDRLAAVLAAFPSEDAMNLEELDGYLCALACSPEEVLPEEYLPLMWGSVSDDDELFPDLEAAREFIDLINRYFAGLMLRLESEEDFKLLLLPDESGQVTGNRWAWGFVQGIRFCPEAWDELVEDEENNEVLLPILALAHELHPDEEFEPLAEPLESETRKLLIEATAAAAPVIYDYFAPAREAAADLDDGEFWPQTPYRRETPKVGRNEPCPCGSGKKYKLCCGREG